MNRDLAWPYVGYCVDDALAEHQRSDIPDPADKVRLVGWQCGFEPMFVAVWSYLGHRLDDETAVELAQDLLREKGWLTAPLVDTEPDYVL